jgi:DNA-directed RNA polymerase subunit RPC12/RpoP
MPVRITCTACDKKLQIRDDAVGKKIKCPGCGGIFVAKGDASAAIKAAPSGPARPSTTATTRTPPPVKSSPKPQAKRPAPPPPPLDEDDEDDEDDIDERPARPSKRRVRHVKSSSGLVLWLVLGLVVVLGGAVGVYFLFFHNTGTTPIAKGNNPLQGNNAGQPGAALGDLVPGDSFAFATVSGDIWNAPALDQIRQGFGKEAEAVFEKEVGFPIGDLERVSMFSVGDIAQAKQNPAPPMVVLVQTKKPVDQTKVTQALKSSQFGKDPTLAIEFLSNTAFVAGQQPMLQRYKDQRGKVKATGVLERALTQAATSKGAIIAVTIPPEAAQEAKDVPPQFAVLLKAKEFFASVDLTDKLLLNASL